MISARLGQSWGSIAQATVVAVALCCGAATAEPAAAQAAPWRLFVTPAAAATTERDLTEDHINAAVKRVVDDRSKDGLFVFRDPKINADLSLVYEKVKIVRGMEGYGWFANTIFHDNDNDKKQYAIDLWFKPDGSTLKLMDIRVQKGPQQEGDGWTMITRMPVAWWWLPVQEHPGDTEVTRAWQVMSAIHNYVATQLNQRQPG